MKIDPDKLVSHYKILSEIGKGGMGEVYLAQDTELDRKVAIKFLAEEFGKDSDKLNRFIQEAKAVSALNHPNILTIYQIGEFEERRFIATEYIEGETLRDAISNKESLSLDLILKIGIQTAEALSAAHQAGIAHRDVKPENMMIRKDGYVKILDFGLAKLTEKGNPEGEVSLEGETKALVKTNPGVVMGTASYMSPEQARGKETDERTDIWSLGVVLYEMLSGKVPFSGETINHTIVAILETEPKLLENVPAELQRIIRKTLTKGKDNRYQTARDLAIDLTNLRRELDLQGELERSIIPEKETEGAIENETAVYEKRSVNQTIPPRPPETQNVTNSSSLEYAVTQAKGHKLLFSVIGLLFIGAIAALVYFLSFASGGDTIKSIAVMPFVNESGDNNLEYLSDGMTETLISGLSNISNLTVKARSSVFRYKGTNVEPKKVGGELNVQALLLGRVVQRGEELTISLELVETATENVLWSERFNRKLEDLVKLQSDIARDVSNKLRTKLSAVEREKVAKSYTTNSEAQRLYLEGRFHWNKRNVESFDRAIKLFKRAIEIDPQYALAYTGLADSYAFFAAYSGTKIKQYMPLAKESALNALELDDTLAEAHASLGNVLFYYDYNWADAEREYRRAIELDPGYASAHQWLAELQSQRLQHDLAMKSIKHAIRLEPLSLIINRVYGDILRNAGRQAEAAAQYEKTLELDPTFQSARIMLGEIYLRLGKYDEAFAQFKYGVTDEGELKELSRDRRNIEKFGFESAEKIRLEERVMMNRNFGGTRFQFAVMNARLRKRDQTLEYLNEAYDKRDFSLTLLKVIPAFDFLRDDPRFKELIKKVGFPE